MAAKNLKKYIASRNMRSSFVKTVVLILFFLFTIQGFTLNFEKNIAGIGSAVAETNPIITAGDLKTGDRLVDKSWQWEYRTGSGYSGTGETKPVTWIVVSNNHYGFRSGMTLLSEELIAAYLFDESDDVSNHWGTSGAEDSKRGIRPWLNGEFLAAFSHKFKESIITVNLPNADGKTGRSYISRDRVFIPSTTELGDSNAYWTYGIGRPFPYFADAPNNKRTAKLGERNTFYWTRSPYSGNSSSVMGISSEGDFGNYFQAHREIHGVRPVICIDPETPVKKSDDPGEENLYEIIWPVVEKDATVSPQVTAFVHNFTEEITLNLNRGTRNLIRITAKSAEEESETLIRGEDYTVSGNRYIFPASFFEKKSVGDIEIFFIMNGGENPRADIKIINKEDNRQFIKELRIGDRLIDKSWRWQYRLGPDYSYTYLEADNSDIKYVDDGYYHAPVNWIITAINHYGPDSGYTLLSEHLIGRHHYDNSTNEHYMGSSHWADSSIRSWLNSSFLSSFSYLFRSSVLHSSIPCTEDITDFVYNENTTIDDMKRDYLSEDKIFLPSEKELNGEAYNASSLEKVWPFFKDATDADRQSTINGEHIPYWTRTPYITRKPYQKPSRPLRQVFTTGRFTFATPYNTHRGIRPAVNINPDTALISVTRDHSGFYEFIYPSAEKSIIEPQRNITITPGESKELFLTLNDQFGNPLLLEPGSVGTSYFESRQWMESVDVDYSYGEDNMAKVTLRSATEAVSTSYPTIYAYGISVFRLPRLEIGYSDFSLSTASEKYTAGETFTIQIENPRDINGDSLTETSYISAEIKSEDSDYQRTIYYHDVQFVDERAIAEGKDLIFGYTLDKAGKYTITKKISAVTEPKIIELEITPAKIEKVILEPSESVELNAGEEMSFKASAYDRFNNLVTSDVIDFSWSTAGGKFMSNISGQYEVWASINGIKSQHVPVTVNPAAPGSSQSIISSTQVLSLEPGEKKDIILTVHDIYENPIHLGTDAKGESISILQSDKTPLDESPWIEDIAYDYSYGTDNQAKITIQSSSHISGSSKNLIIKAGEQILIDDYTVKSGSYGKISPSQKIYRENSADDLSFVVAGDTTHLLTINDGEKNLSQGSDFIKSGNSLIISSSYLADMATDIGRRKLNLLFTFGGTSPAKVVAEVTLVREPSVQPAVIDYFPNSGQNVDIYINFDFNELKGIRKDNGTTLEEDKDYTLKGKDAITLSGEFLNSLNYDSAELFFETKSGSSPEVLINIITAQNEEKADEESEALYMKSEDINKSDNVTVADAIIILRHIVGLTDLNDSLDNKAMERAIVSGNGKLSVSDAILILRRVVGLE